MKRSSAPSANGISGQRSASRGFSLVELLAVLAIISILAAIAYPGYASYVTRARRVEGQVALLTLMQQQEQYFSEHNTYLAFEPDAQDADAKHFQWWSGSAAASSAYELRGQACAGQTIAQCVELRALPGTERVDTHFRDGDCGTLSLTSTGEQRASGRGEHCWP